MKGIFPHIIRVSALCVFAFVAMASEVRPDAIDSSRKWGAGAGSAGSGVLLSAVPEPTFYLLLLAGVGCLFFTAKRKGGPTA
jgi:hypothetical protein